MLPEVRKNIFNLKKRYIYIAAALVLCAAAAAIVVSVLSRRGEAPKTPESKPTLLTRTVLDHTAFFAGERPKPGITLSWQDKTIRLNNGDPVRVKLSGAVYPVNVSYSELTYTSSNEDVAEIDDEGNILAKMPGSAEITVTNETRGLSLKAYLTVVQPVTGFYLNKSTIELYTTDTGIRLEPQIFPKNASNTALIWRSKDTSVAEVDQTGHIKPRSVGMTEIVASTTDGGFESKCFVNVINRVIKAEQVVIQNKDNVELDTGESWWGVASVLPVNAKNKGIIWDSSDNSVAMVTKTGKVTAVSAGTAVITASNADGPYDEVTIRVKGSPAPSSEVNINHNSYVMPGGVTYTAYSLSLDDMAQRQMNLSPKYNEGGGFRAASAEQVREYLDPNEFCAGAYKYQFMDLSKYNGVSRDALNAFLDGKGILSGQADAFIQAARTYNVSEIYLVAHACIETGNGTSQLATGVEVNGVRVYNMYGIGAIDSGAVSGGANTAYSQGWTTPAEAISGGAKWISENYINSAQYRQNTLYKMRWNPENPGQHLYATDVSWAAAQAVIIDRIMSELPSAAVSYEIPVYAGLTAPVIN